MKESDFQKDVLSWLKKQGYKCWKNYLGPMVIHGGRRVKNPNAGQPDIFVIKKDGSGTLLGIELKSDRGKLQECQRKEIMDLESHGVYVIAARDMDYLIEKVEEWENGKKSTKCS
jgi:hypothetical protein